MNLLEKMHLQSVQNCSLPWKLRQVYYLYVLESLGTQELMADLDIAPPLHNLTAIL